MRSLTKIVWQGLRFGLRTNLCAILRGVAYLRPCLRRHATAKDGGSAAIAGARICQVILDHKKRRP